MNAIPFSHGDEPMPGRGLPMLHNLVYCSRATAGVDDAAVDRIVASARRRNPGLGITGMLVFGSGVFFQWLEGPRDSISQLMALLRSDPRHENIIQLTETEEVRERMFPDWDMELVTSDHIRDVLLDAISAAGDEKNAEALGHLLAHLDAGPLSDPATA